RRKYGVKGRCVINVPFGVRKSAVLEPSRHARRKRKLAAEMQQCTRRTGGKLRWPFAKQCETEALPRRQYGIDSRDPPDDALLGPTRVDTRGDQDSQVKTVSALTPQRRHDRSKPRRDLTGTIHRRQNRRPDRQDLFPSTRADATPSTIEAVLS